MTREEAIKVLKTENCYECSYGCGETINCPAEDCPLPEAVKMAIKALEQEPCDDAISRQAVLDIVNNPLNIRLDEIIKKLPPVNPQPNTGHWINNHNGTYTCDKCGGKHSRSNYCPNCGAKMVEPQESEVTE